MNHDSTADSDLERTEWMRTTAALRRVACSVGASAVEAEDIAQSTLLAALLERARGGAPGPGWLRAAARNRTIDWLRRGERRTGSPSDEELAERGASTPAPPEIALQFEVQRSLMAAVEALPDPYREVIFLRYFEEISVPQIADRKGVPVPTVRTWLTRAHGRLREQLLDPDEHRSPAWIAAFVEFGRGPSGTLLPPFGDAGITVAASPVPIASLSAAAFLMSLKTLTAAALALAVIGLGWKLALDVPDAEAPDLVTVKSDDVEPVDATARMAQVQTTEARRDATAIEEVKPVEAVGAPAPVTDERVAVRGIVFDGSGKRMAGMRIRLEPPLPGMKEAVTSAQGEFEGMTILEEDARARLTPTDDGLAVLFWKDISRYTAVEREAPAMLAVAPAQSILGTVVGEDGEAISGARLRLELPDGFPSRFSEILLEVTIGNWEVRSSVDGAFEFEDAPSLAGCKLTVSADGYLTKVLEDVPVEERQRSSGELVITLAPQDPGRIVRGVVLDPSGNPVAKARVGLGVPARITDATGEFEFDLDGDDGASTGPQRLLATARGWCPVEFAPDAAADGSIEWPEFVELRLQRESLSIEGVVLDREGQPKASVAVWLEDLTILGEREGESVVIAENLGWPVSRLHTRYKTDEAGKFRIQDLAAREYTLVAMDLDTLWMSQPKVIAAGDSGAVLQLDPAIELEEVTGRVVDSAGAPLEGVSLEWSRLAQWVRQPGKNGALGNFVTTEPVLTAADGKFTFARVPLDERLRLKLSKRGYQPMDVPMDELDLRSDDLSIVLGARCDVKVFCEDRVDSVQLLDAEGQALTVYWFPEPGTTASSTAKSVKDGVSLPFQVSEFAVQVQFLDGPEVIATKAIHLELGKLNEIRQ